MAVISKVLAIVLFGVGTLMLLPTSTTITGAFTGANIISFSFWKGLGLLFLILSLLLLAAGETLEEKLSRRRILPRREFAHLSSKGRAFRKKLVNLFDEQKQIDPKKIAYLLPRYKKVKDTEEFIPGHQYKVYKGKVGNHEEYFTVDTRELKEMELGGERYLLPTHIDIQRRLRKNRYLKIGRAEIPWEELLKYSEDILDYFKRRT